MLFSSKSGVWETPQDFFDRLDEEFHFETDVCAIPENAKCEHYFSPEQDGLAQEWTGVCWCNPPYGRDVIKWVKKAAESNATTVMLLHARTDTKWFHEYVLPNAEIRFVRGRLKFDDGNGIKNSAPFPSVVCIFRNNIENGGETNTYRTIENQG